MALKISFLLILIGMISSIPGAVFGNDRCTAVDLKCEYLINPLGIDVAHPRFSWRLKDNRRGAKQTAYKIFVSTDSLELVKRNGTIWESEKVNSGNNLSAYAGKPLEPFTKYFWVVDVWDKDGNKSSLAEVASFETGLMEVKTGRETGSLMVRMLTLNRNMKFCELQQ